MASTTWELLGDNVWGFNRGAEFGGGKTMWNIDLLKRLWANLRIRVIFHKTTSGNSEIGA